jgi:ribosomal-protein-alanine N-acetyltransferase
MITSNPEPMLRVSDLVVRRGRAGDEAAIVAYFERNRAHLSRWSPMRPVDFYSVPHWQRALAEADAGFPADRLMHCFLFREESGDGVGEVNLSNFVRRAFQACHMGYAIDRALEGTGRMSAAVSAVVEFAFAKLHMHRVMANYLPENERSARLLARLGFEREGLARDYLHIDGQWRDHVLTSKINPGWA